MQTETEILSAILSRNINSPLTPELATGIVAVYAEQRAKQLAAAQPTENEPAHADAG